MDIDEVYDKIGSNYPYSYHEFLEAFTPKMATRFLELISIRENNDYCYNAMLHGHDMKKQIISPKVPASIEKISDEQREMALKHAKDTLKRRQDVKG